MKQVLGREAIALQCAVFWFCLRTAERGACGGNKKMKTGGGMADEAADDIDLDDLERRMDGAITALKQESRPCGPDARRPRCSIP